MAGERRRFDRYLAWKGGGNANHVAAAAAAAAADVAAAAAAVAFRRDRCWRCDATAAAVADAADP